MTNVDFIIQDIKEKLPQFLTSAQFKEAGADWEYSLFNNLTDYIINNIEDKKLNENSEEIKKYMSILNDLIESKNKILQSVAYTEGIEVIDNNSNFRNIFKAVLDVDKNKYQSLIDFYNTNTKAK